MGRSGLEPHTSAVDGPVQLARHVRGDGKPASITARPDIRVAAVPLLAVRRPIAGAGVDDGDIPQHAHSDVLRREASDCGRPSRVFQELPLVDERSIGVGAQKNISQDLVKTPDIATLHRIDAVAVEGDQLTDVALQPGVGSPLHTKHVCMFYGQAQVLHHANICAMKTLRLKTVDVYVAFDFECPTSAAQPLDPPRGRGLPIPTSARPKLSASGRECDRAKS